MLSETSQMEKETSYIISLTKLVDTQQSGDDQGGSGIRKRKNE